MVEEGGRPLPSAMLSNQQEAGRLLGGRLAARGYVCPVVLALSSDALPAGREIAQALRAPLALLGPQGGAADLPPGVLLARELGPMAGCSVILVAERIASSCAVQAALRVLRLDGPRRVVLATPAAAAESLAPLDGQVDAVFCLARLNQPASIDGCYAEWAEAPAPPAFKGMDKSAWRGDPCNMPRKNPKADANETRGRELAGLLDEIGSGAIDDLADLTEAQLALLRAHLTEEEVEKLFDRTAGPERD